MPKILGSKNKALTLYVHYELFYEQTILLRLKYRMEVVT